MATETNETPAVTAAKTAEAQTQTVTKAARAAAKTGTRRARKASKPARAAKRAATATRRQARATRTERTTEVNFQPNAFAGFGAFPAAAGFEKLVNETTGRSEEFAKRSRKAVEELSDVARGNVDAIVEASRIAASGAQSIAQKALTKSRDSVELAADTVRSMAEAKNPSDLLQLQAEFVRGAFDRFVSESSNLTESMVKLAGESFQPISNRATRNVERFNDIIA
ncbi:MAG TPA: phasin family protein [Sphingomicrobium sp.]|nr:phasin family protein [Sphingomicrobium sp.]